jgi:DNA polymerase I
MIKYLIFDTETTGLNIVLDTPFLFAYIIADERLEVIEECLFNEDDVQAKTKFINYVQQATTIVGHNIKFDVHMCINAGINQDLFKDKNYIDTGVLARLVLSHDVQAQDNFSTALKNLSVKYLNSKAADEQKILKTELSLLTMTHKNNMKQFFIDKGIWDTKLKETQQTDILNAVYKNWNKVYHLYNHLKDARKEYFEKYPAPNYKDCSNVRPYAMTDVRLTYQLFRMWYPRVLRLDQVPTIKRISKIVFPLLCMERKGLTVDLNQLSKDRAIVLKEINKIKIIDPRTKQEIRTGQHAKLRELYEYESGESLQNADKFTRRAISDKSSSAKLVEHKAKLEKYLNSYITRVLNKLVVHNNEYKIFTDYKIDGTVTGRLSGDFQQFPKEPLILDNGTEINIRSWFTVPKEDKYMVFFDYSQMELRLQCEWTNLVNNEPDINLARAFSPYKCIEINGEYYYEEDHYQKWKPIDLHALTAKNAFPFIDETHSEWEHYRSLGKRANFAANYGATPARLQEALRIPFHTAKALIDGYKKTYKGVVQFGQWIKRYTYTHDNVPNLLLRRYYTRNKHLLQNWLIQGSGADILFEKTTALFKYIEDKPHWNLYLSVHDETVLTCKDINITLLKKEIEEIRTLLKYSLSAVDIIADVEITETKWSEKTEVERLLK